MAPGHLAQSSPSASVASVEVIPGKLKVKIFLHDITSQGESISCWSYLTDGLKTQRQKEMILTLCGEKDQKPEKYLQDILGLFVKIYSAAEQGRVLDAGDAILFGDTGFVGRKDVRGIGLVEAEDFPGVENRRPTARCNYPERR